MLLLHCGADGDSAFEPGSQDAAPRPDRPTPIDPSDARSDDDAAPSLGLEAVQVVTGDAHTCAIGSKGRVYCWGDNTYGQLGLSLDVLATSVPREVVLPTDVQVVQLAAGASHTCALTDRKNLVCWGRNDLGQVARAPSGSAAPEAVVLPSALATTTFVSIVAGHEHTCAIYIQPEVTDGGAPDAAPGEEVLRMACWGDNQNAQLARDDVAFTDVPADIRRGAGGTSGPSVVAQLAALGAEFSAASLRVGEGYRVQAWGNPRAGGVTSDPDGGLRVAPTSVLQSDGGWVENVVSIRAGASHACATLRVALDPDAGSDGGDVDVDAALEDAGESDADLPDAGDEADADAGPPTALRVVCWGANELGQLARETVSERELAEPIGTDTSNVEQIVLGGRSTCVIDRGALRCAGANDFGQLGVGTFDSQPHATLGTVSGLANAVFSASIGTRHACALVERTPGVTQIACWGDNRQGQLGDGIALGSGYADASSDDRYRRARPGFVVPPN